MNYERIASVARKLKNGCNTREAAELCGYLDILISYVAMGREENSIKGFITTNSRCSTITLNSDFPEEVQNIVCFHEIGHRVLGHRLPGGLFFFHDSSLFNNSNRFEVEANTFVADYLLDDKETIEVLREFPDYFAAASVLHVPKAILGYKVRLMNYYGKLNNLREFPIEISPNCMGRLPNTIIRGGDY